MTPGTRQYPRQPLSPETKHRFRTRFVLADRKAKRVDPPADPLSLDAEGDVAR